MSKYTTEVRFICESYAGLDKSVGYDSVSEVIDKSYAKIFDFDFPIFDEDYRVPLIKKILEHYYTREIAHETVGLWKLKLRTKMNEIMPYFNQLYLSEKIAFEPLNTKDVTIRHEGKGTSESESSREGKSVARGSNTGWSLYSDTPQGTVGRLDDETYLTNATKSTANSNGTNESEETGTGSVNSTDEYMDRITGYEGKNPSESLLKFRETFRNIDMEVINSLEELFFQLW